MNLKSIKIYISVFFFNIKSKKMYKKSFVIIKQKHEFPKEGKTFREVLKIPIPPIQYR